MALKDLAATRASVNEDAIEEIVRDFIRYDTEERAIVLSSEGCSLGIGSKVLAFLTANEGWCYVSDEIAPVAIAPKQMEEALGVKGGSLRPKLAELAKLNLIKKQGGGYRIVPANLPRIRKELLGS